MSCNPAIRAFNAQAAQYNQLACVQQRIAEQFFTVLPIQAIDYGLVLDIGCGTGFLTQQIKQRYGDNSLIALDAAPGMLACLPKLDRLQTLCADFNAIPLADNSCDAVFSSVALQWSRATEQTMQEWLRLLKPGGRLYFSTLLAGTLQEWDTCWEQLGDERRVNALLAEQQLLSLALPKSCELKSQQCVRVMDYHATAQGALASVRGIGASRRLQPLARNGLMGQKKWRAFLSAYERMRTDKGLPLSYEVFYGTIEKK
jgi:malonyl-CoA O-methyltransferase